MPSPVSPDAGVPEHQPDQRRQSSRPRTSALPRQTPNGPPQNGGRPQSGQLPTGRTSGQFEPGQLLPGQFPSGQFATRPGATPPPPGFGRVPEDPVRGDGDNAGERGNTSTRDRIWIIVAFVVAAGVIAAVGLYFFSPDADEEPTTAWAVDSCAGPDPTAEDTGAATDTYRPLLCDDPEATVTVLDIQDAARVEQVHCPAGTDVVFQKEGQAGGDTQAVCARNLSDDHPGDPGQGGGQLLAGDCVNGDGGEVACSADGAREVTGVVIGGIECPDGTADELELGFDASRSYETICLGE